jgi:CheY-like chemotaxis protein
MPPLRILVVDDQPLVARAMARYLQGHHVEVASTCAGAFRVLASQAFDIVFADLNLHDGTGLEVLAAAPRSLRVVISGLPPGPSHEEAVARGEMVWLTKPFRRADLMAVLDSCQARTHAA